MPPARVACRKPWVFLLALLLIFCLGGCDFMKRLKQEKEKESVEAEPERDATAEPAKVDDGTRPGSPLDVPRAPAPKTPTASAPLDADQLLGQKLDHPIDCINGASLGVTRSHERYLGWVKDPKVGPTGKEMNVYGLYEVQAFQVEACKKALAALASTPEPPTPDLEKAAVDYAAKLDAVVPLVAEAFKYYELKNYQDDGFAKAKAMHGPLIAAFEAFEVSATALHEQVGKLKSGLAERELDRVERTLGKKLLWHRQKYMLLAKRVVDLGDVEDAKIDLAKLEAATRELEDLHSAMEAYAKANPGEAQGMYSMFAGNALDLLKAAKELHRRLRDKTPWSRGDLMMLEANSAWMVNGSQAKLLRKYNDLVSSSNTLNGSPF